MRWAGDSRLNSEPLGFDQLFSELVYKQLLTLFCWALSERTLVLVPLLPVNTHQRTTVCLRLKEMRCQPSERQTGTRTKANTCSTRRDVYYMLFCSYFKCFITSLLNKNYRTCDGFNGNCIGFNGNYNGVYWYMMDSIGGMLNILEKWTKLTSKMNFVMVLLENANGS